MQRRREGEGLAAIPNITESIGLPKILLNVSASAHLPYSKPHIHHNGAGSLGSSGCPLGLGEKPAWRGERGQRPPVPTS